MSRFSAPIPAAMGGWILVSVCALLVVGCQRGPAAKPQPSPTVSLPPPPAKPSPRQEPIFFIKGDASLSPGALIKLKTWVEAWGKAGRWILSCPSVQGFGYDLLERRILAIRAELRKLGVTRVETVLLPSEPEGQYDVIYVANEPI